MIHPSATLKNTDKPFKSSELIPACHVATSCDYRESVIGGTFIENPLNQPMNR